MTTENQPNTNFKSPGNSFIESADELLDELTRMASRETERRDFYRHLTDRLHNLADALRVSVWVVGPNQTCVAAVGSTSKRVFDESSQPRFEISSDRFEEIVAGTEAIYLEGPSAKVFAVPVCVSQQEQKIITLEMRNQMNPQMAKVYLDLIDAVGDVAANFERHLLVDQQAQTFSKMESFVQLLRNSTSTLNLKQLGYHLTNDCRKYLKADRVWLFSVDGRHKLICCSGVSGVNPRSKAFRSLKGVVSEAVRFRKSYSYIRGESELDSKYRQLNSYVDAESTSGFYVMMLKRHNSNQVNGVLVAEFLRDHDRMSVIAGLKNIVPCVESSFANSNDYSRVPFRRALQMIGWLIERFKLRSLPKTLLFLGALGMLLVALFGIQADFEIGIEGELQPVVQRHVFAPTAALVDSIFVEYGDSVQAEQPVAKLVSQDYELKIRELQNEHSAVRKRLEANQILRTQAKHDGRDSVYLGQLTAEIEQNSLAIASINETVKWYLEKTNALEVKSPIAGQVISRDVRLSLLKRPVIGGSRLLTIADTEGVWHIVFDVPDREFGYLLAAKRSSDVDQWKIEVRLESEFETTFESTIAKVDQNNTFDENGESFVRVFVPVQRSDLKEMRIGQSVFGKVHCGKKSLFFIWTRDVRDFVRTHFFWM